LHETELIFVRQVNNLYAYYGVLKLSIVLQNTRLISKLKDYNPIHTPQPHFYTINLILFHFLSASSKFYFLFSFSNLKRRRAYIPAENTGEGLSWTKLKQGIESCWMCQDQMCDSVSFWKSPRNYRPV